MFINVNRCLLYVQTAATSVAPPVTTISKQSTVPPSSTSNHAVVNKTNFTTGQLVGYGYANVSVLLYQSTTNWGF